MQKHLNIAALQVRLWVVTVLLAVLGFALVAEFSDQSDYSDGTARVRVAEIIEHSGDSESPLTSFTSFIPPPASFTIACVMLFALLPPSHQRKAPRSALVRNRHSRAPPSLPQV